MRVGRCQIESSGRSYSVAALLLLLSAGIAACEENLVPREPFESPFSLYGVLSPDLDTQAVRVYVPEEFPTLGTAAPLDVDFTSIDLDTGERRTWRDSVMVDQNGQHGHIFWAPFRAEFGRAYRIEAVRRSDGATSYAEVRIPSPVSVRFDETDAPLLHVFIEGRDIRALAPEAVYDVYRILRDPETGVIGPLILRYKVSYAGEEESIAQGWHLKFNMIVDAFEINLLYNGEVCRRCGGVCRVNYVFLGGMELHLFVGDEVWNPPGGVFDPAVLSQPQIMSNVENGLGFIGGGYRIAVSLDISREAVESACFRYGF